VGLDSGDEFCTTHAFSYCWSDFEGEETRSIGVSIDCPRPEAIVMQGEGEALDCRLGECGGVRAMEQGVELISNDLLGETGGAVVFVIQDINALVVEMRVVRKGISFVLLSVLFWFVSTKHHYATQSRKVGNAHQ